MTVSTPGDVTVGVTGLPARWSVTAWGALAPWGEGADAPALDWFVAADDRWHVPATEPTVRRVRVDGTPVLETRIRIPDGDAVQRIWAVADGGGSAIVEFENESPLPIAVAVAGREVATARPTSDVPIEGIDVPEPSIVLPIGHHATVRVALGGLRDPSSASPHLAVVRGWQRVCDGASRLLLPDPAVSEAVVAARCDLLLEGPVDPEADPAGFLLDVAELVRCGDDAAAWMVDMVGAAERVAASGRSASGPDALDVLGALSAARMIAVRADDGRAADDIDRIIARIASRAASTERPPTSFADLRDGSSTRGRLVRAVERRLADDGALLAGGFPASWLGTNFEVHGLPTGPTSTVSYAVRWHGERPAVLWEQHGDPITLTAPTIDPDWSTDEASGEALWAEPPRAQRSSLSLSVDPDGGSFR